MKPLAMEATDVWSLVPFPRATRLGSAFADTYPQAVCHQRNATRDRSVTTFCFSPGIGKVYEVTEGVEEERLVYPPRLPGCKLPEAP
jgi:hypothetical protein